MRLIKFVKETKNELKKVVWPKKDKVITDTTTVVILSLLVAAFLGLLDVIFNNGLQRIM